MRLKKLHRKILKPSRRKAVEVRMLEKRAIGSHLRWTAMAAFPGCTPLAAVLMFAAGVNN